MKVLLILNDPPYGTERNYNALRLAGAMLKEKEKPDLTVFLMADAVACGKTGQSTPDGFYNVETMVKGVARNANVLLCGTCMDARGLKDDELVAGAVRSTMPELARHTQEADQVIVF